MNRIKKLFSDKEAVGERELPVGTTVEASFCIRVDDGWLAVASMAGAIVKLNERPSYQEPDDTYEGALARVMPREPWPPGERFAIRHPLTLKLDAHEAQVGGESMAARWVVHHVHAIETGASLIV